MQKLNSKYHKPSIVAGPALCQPALRVTSCNSFRITLREELSSCSTSHTESERWTVNLIPARMTRRAEARASSTKKNRLFWKLYLVLTATSNKREAYKTQRQQSTIQFKLGDDVKLPIVRKTSMLRQFPSSEIIDLRGATLRPIAPAPVWSRRWTVNLVPARETRRASPPWLNP